MARIQSYLVRSNPRAALYSFISPFAAAHNKYVATSKERWHRLVDRGWTASGHGVFILNFPLGEDRVCWCYLNHCVNLVIDECKVNRSIKVLQSSTERSPYRVTGRALRMLLFSFFLLVDSLTHNSARPHWGYATSWKFNKGFPYYGCFDIHVSFLSNSADKTKCPQTSPHSSCLWIFIEYGFADETRCITVSTVTRVAHFTQVLIDKCCLLAPGLLWRGDRWAPHRRFNLQSHHRQLSTTNLIKVKDSSAFWDESGPPWTQTILCGRCAVSRGWTRILLWCWLDALWCHASVNDVDLW